MGWVPLSRAKGWGFSFLPEPAARKPETVTSQVNRIQSSPLLFFFLSHFIRDASSHTEQLPSFYFCPFGFFFSSVGHCQVDLGVHQNKTSQNSSWTEIFYRIYQVGKYLRRSLGSPLCLKLGQGWTQTSFQRVLSRQSLEISKDESSTTFLGHVYLKKPLMWQEEKPETD